MKKIEKEFLQDTIDILVSYDGEHESGALKSLVDETRERLIKLANGRVVKKDLGYGVNGDNWLDDL